MNKDIEEVKDKLEQLSIQKSDSETDSPKEIDEEELKKQKQKQLEEEIFKKKYFCNEKLAEEIPDENFFMVQYDETIGDPKSKVGYAYDEFMLKHYHEDGHSERPQRVKAINYNLLKQKLKHQMARVECKEISDRVLLNTHTQDHLDKIKQIEQNHKDKKFETFNSQSFCGDIYENEFSRKCAYMSAGGCQQAVDLVCTGMLQSAFCNVRPPGHHANADVKCEATGFCFFNNVAIAAKYAISTYKHIKKVVIFDWDVHHGDGTQRCLYDRNDILFISLHRYDDGGFYPGFEPWGHAGHFSKIGEGQGTGYNINIPWKTQLGLWPDHPSNIGSEEYIYICKTLLFPIIKQFSPDLILISAGFDSAKGDPLGNLTVTPKGYAWMTEGLKQIQKKMIVCLEGGYNKNSLAISSEAVVRILLNEKLPFKSLSMTQTFEQMEIQNKPKLYHFDSFLPGLVSLLSHHWKCLDQLKTSLKSKIDELSEQDFKPPERSGCNIF